MNLRKVKSEKNEVSFCVPREKDKWKDDDLFKTVVELSHTFHIAFVMLTENTYFTDYYQKDKKPWIGKSSPKKVVIIWDAVPMDPAAILSWRCGLIEEQDVSYKFLFIPEEKPANWKEWIENHVGDWGRPLPKKEKKGVKLGELVIYNQSNPFTQMVGYDPAFLTISHSGKMADVLEQLDECKRIFREVIGRKVKERREKVHEVLDELLAASFMEKEDPIDRHGEVKSISDRLQRTLSKNNFMVDRNRLPRVLLLGPSGVGKTLVARYLAWSTSPGPGEELSRPFKRVPLPEYLDRENAFEYDLFGCCAGAYTGAPPGGEKGFLLERMGGVIFFDEIGDANPAIQAKMLAYLDDYQVTPRGWSGEPVFCPMLVIAATNRSIDQWAAKDPEESQKDIASYFRNDLFQRFNYLIRVPELNDRRQEISFIVDTMLQMPAFNPDRKVREMGANALKKLMEYDYSRGNFRDLENLLRDACRKAVRDGRSYIVEADIISIGDLHL